MIKLFKSYIGVVVIIIFASILLLYINSKSFNTTKFNVNNESNTIADLTSNKYQGCLAGTEGNVEVQKYIENYFKKIGVKPGGDNGTYYQNFNSMLPTYNCT